MPVDARRGERAASGDIVVAQPGGGDGRLGRLRVDRVLGRPEVARDVIEALLVDRGYPRGFDSAVEADAERAARQGGECQRRDLTKLETFTIDPASARDFDDAVSIERLGDGLRLSVHIADVSAYVAPGSSLDGEAERRGNSVYVPGTVEPMLPETLSGDTCSLVEGIPRDTVTTEMTIDGSGNVQKAAFYRSTIRSNARLDYDQVGRVFAGSELAPGPVADTLALARELAATLRERRLARGALAVESSEPEFDFDSHGHVVAGRDIVQTEAHGLIEELMILTNEQIGSTLEQKRIPTIFRVHDRPDPSSIERLVEQLESLDVPTPALPGNVTPAQAMALAGRISAVVADYVRSRGRGQALVPLVLRALKQAVYSTDNLGHSGLASGAYCHFTSPIRRYPDLVVHRSLLSMLGSGQFTATRSELRMVADHCSDTERAATEAEHTADDICLAFLLEKLLYEEGWETEFEGEVSGVTNGAAFVSFGSVPGGASCEGFLPARKLRHDWYDLNEQETALVGRDTGTTLRIGDPVNVTVRSVDPPRGRVDLEPAGWPQ
jgi:ribonuclease R